MSGQILKYIMMYNKMCFVRPNSYRSVHVGYNEICFVRPRSNSYRSVHVG